jgi:cytoskeletal protein CcmA (bactofilin family)
MLPQTRWLEQPFLPVALVVKLVLVAGTHTVFATYPGSKAVFTDADGHIVPLSDDAVDLGTSSVEFRNAYFDGTVTSDAFAGPLTGAVTGNADTATTSTNITASANNSTDETVYPTFVDGATGTQGIETDTGLTYNPSTGTFTSTVFVGALTGNASGSSGSCTGNAATVTNGVYTTSKISVLAATSSSELAGVISDETGSGSLVFSNSPTLVTPALGTPSALVGTNISGTASSLTAGTATVATTVTITDNESTNEDNAIVFTAGGDVDGGNLGLESDGDLIYNPSTGTVTATIFKGNIDAVDGDFDGTLEADAYTVDGVALNEYIADTVGAMVGSNTETNIAVTYEDGDNTLDFVIGTLNQDTTGTADNFTVSANNSTDETVYPVFVDGATGSQGAETDTGFTYNPSSGLLTIAGELDAGSLDISGNADIDGTLEADAITVDGTTLAEYIADTVGAMVGSNTETGITVSYEDGDNTLDFVIGTLNQDTTGTAAIATTVTITDNESTNEDNAIIFTAGGDVDGGNLGLESDGTLTYNPSTGKITATGFIGALTGNADTATVATTVTITDNESTNEDNAIIFTAGGDVDGGNIGLESDGDLHYNPSTGTVTATIFKGNIDAVDGDFDGTLEADAITVGGSTLASVIAGTTVSNATTAAVATTVTITDNESTNEENAIIFTAGGDVDGGNIGLESDGTMTYNPSTGTITATIFKGNVDAVDGDFDGTLEADAITIGGTNVVTGSLITTLGTVSAGVWQGTAIASSYIAADAIDGSKLADNAVNSEHYTDGSIDTAHIAADQITSALIADDQINSEHYVDGSIDTAHIANNQITNALMADDAVGTAEIADDAITSALIADDAIVSAAIADDAVLTAHIADDQITAALMADNSIDSDMYVDGSIDTAHFAAGAVDAAAMGANSVDSSELVNGSIDTAHIADDQVTLAKMAGLTRGSIIIGDASGDPAALGIGSNTYVLTSDGTDIAWAAASGGGGSGDITGVTLAGDSGSAADTSGNADLTVAGGNGITTSGSSTTLTVALDAALTTVTSLLATDIKIGEDDQTKIDFETADEIHFYAANVEQVYLADNVFGPQSDSDVDLGTTGVRWKDAYIDTITTTGDVDVLGNIELGNASDTTIARASAGQITVEGTAVILAGAVTGITSLLATDIKIGEDDQTKIDFETANEIHFYANNTEQVYLADNIFGPQSDSDVDLGTTGVRWKDAYIDTITTTGTITAGGAVTSNAGIVVDNITIDGTEIDLSSGDLTIDVAADIDLDAGGGNFKFSVGGTQILDIGNSSSDVVIKPVVDTKDIIFQQRDGTEVARIEDDTYLSIAVGIRADAQDGASLGADGYEFSDLWLADAAVCYFGDDGDVTLTHVADTGLLLTDNSGTGTTQLQFGDSGTYVHQSADGALDLVSDGSINLNVGAAGVVIKGTTPKITIGDAGTEDAMLAFDGNAQDFHVALDDTADDLVIGVGTTAGTTTAIAINENAQVSIVDLFAANVAGSFGTFADGDATPSVATGNLWKHHASTQTITMFDDGVAGQTIHVISTAAITYDVTSTNLKGGSTDIVTASGDITSWFFDGTNWYLIQFMDVSADMSSVGGGSGGGSGDVVAGSTFTTAGVIMAGHGDDKKIDEPNTTLTTNGEAMTVSASAAVPFQVNASDRDGNSSFEFIGGTGATNHHAILKVIGNTGASSYLYLGDPDDQDIGHIRYKNNGNSMIFHVNGSNAITIASSLIAEFHGGFNVGSDASGDILYHNGTKYVRLPKGSDSQVLTLMSGIPSWQDSGGMP